MENKDIDTRTAYTHIQIHKLKDSDHKTVNKQKCLKVKSSQYLKLNSITYLARV